MSSSQPEPRSEQEVLARFQDMRQTLNKIMNNLNDIETEAQEHDLVIKQLEPMDKARRCYRMIGDVLVERSVAETLPAVKRNREGLEAVMQQMRQQLEQQAKALQAFQAKYKIRVGQPGADEDGGDGGGNGGGKQQQQQKKQQQQGGKQGGAGVLC